MNIMYYHVGEPGTDPQRAFPPYAQRPRGVDLP